MAKSKQKITLVRKRTTGFLFKEIKSQIEQVRLQVSVSVNQSLTYLYWNIGGLIHHHILEGNRPEYGKEILATMSPKLTAEFGQGYNASSLNRMLKFYRAFPGKNILATLSPKLSWSHFIELVTIEEEAQKGCFIRKWQLRGRL